MKSAERSGSTEDLFTHDAWNRLVKVRRDTGVSTVTISEAEYNGLHWRTVRRADTTVPIDGIDQTRTLRFRTVTRPTAPTTA